MSKDPLRDIQLGTEAARILGSDVAMAALDAMEEQYLDAWKKTTPGDAKEREVLWTMYAGAKAFRGQLTALLNRGRVGANQVERKTVRGKNGVTGLNNVLPTG